VSTPADLDRAYAAFLGSSDLATWTASLAAFGPLLDGTVALDAARPLDLRRALTLGIYVGWHAMRCDAQAERAAAMRGVDDLAARLAARPPIAGPEGTLIDAVIAAAKGYQATARQRVAGLGAALPVELALLVTPQHARAKAASLKPYVVDGAGPTFLPAVYFYGSALLDLGYLSTARALHAAHAGAGASALMTDLDGQLLELEGSWGKARDAYHGSPWVSHAYRHAVCELILGAPIERIAAAAPADAARFAAGMQDFSGETDRAGVLRSESFIRAFRWSGFDNWLVQFELGRVSFQRRRHSAAERHLAAAVTTAPEPFRFAIQSLRFTNLTWLGTSTDTDMRPETIEVGVAALREPAGEDQRGPIRLWLGELDKASPVLEPVIEHGTPYLRGQVHKLRGDTPAAIAAWCDALADRYEARACHELIRVFTSYGFEQTAARITATVALESEHNFFDLWELATEVAAVIKDFVPDRIPGDRLAAELAGVERQLEAVVEAEFQNALRAFRHFAARRQLAPAQRMLARAEALAEGAEELLLLAIARRKFNGVGDERALDALRSAERQSTDRFERLLIGRELVRHGDLAGARGILTEEGVLSDPRDLTAIEYVVALEVAAACAGDDERRRLGAAAGAALQADLAAGRVTGARERYLARLNPQLGDAPIAVVLTAEAEPASLEISDHGAFVAELDRLRTARQGEQELRVLTERVDATGPAGSPAARFTLWGLHLDRFDVQLRSIDRLRPTVADDELPLTRDPSPIRPRAAYLAALWRAQLQAAPDDAERALDRIRTVLATDREDQRHWDLLRRVAAAESSRYVFRYAEQGVMLLSRIAASDRGSAAAPWPVFLGVRQAIVDDTSALTARLQARAAALRERLAR
jgi:hypothetical protein